MKISICICTYDRPVLLQKLLEALQTIELDGALQNVCVDLLVIDNHPNPHTQSLCHNFARDFPIPLHYVAESFQGISQARNRAVIEALAREADFIAFIDDDDLPRPDWLAALASQQKKSRADIVFGCWVAATSEPEWALRYRVFKSMPHGKDDQKPGRFGLPRMASTCNVLIGRDVLIKAMADGEVFDLDLSHCGGEDKEFFIRALAYGFRVSSAENSIVMRHHVPERYSARGMIQRGFKNGCSRMRKLRAHSGLMEPRYQARVSRRRLFKLLLSLPFCILNKGQLMRQLYMLGKEAGAIYFFASGRSYKYYNGRN
jgi:succinoglycan biosynthesis protein ExoM